MWVISYGPFHHDGHAAYRLFHISAAAGVLGLYSFLCLNATDPLIATGNIHTLQKDVDSQFIPISTALEESWITVI